MFKIIRNTILCPRCFHRFSKSQIEFLCQNANCSTEVISGNKFEKRANDLIAICTTCGRKSNTRRCPHCHEILPRNIIEDDTKVVSVVGASSCGKSYYVGSLLRLLRKSGSLSSRFGLATYWDMADVEQYKTRYEDYFESHVPIPGTEATADILVKYPPIVVGLSKREKKRFGGTKNIHYNFSFFDAAGENFEDSVILASVTPYLQNSSSMLLLLDPRQIETVNSAIMKQYPYLRPLEKEKMSVDLLTNVTRVLSTEKKLINKSEQFKIPLFITIGKWDLVMNTPDLLPDGLTVNCPSAPSGVYDEATANAISNEIRSLINKWCPDLVIYAEQHFAEVHYFACSSWGTPGDKGDTPEINSFRVEDPFLWQLHREGMI